MRGRDGGAPAGREYPDGTERGYGKRSPLDDYREQNRGGYGIITIKTSARNGPVIAVLQVDDQDEVMLISSGSKVLRLRTDGIPTMGRNTQGVRLMELDPDERIVSVARVAEREDGANLDASGA